MKRFGWMAALMMVLCLGLGACGNKNTEAPPAKPDLDKPKTRAGQMVKEARDAKKKLNDRAKEMEETTDKAKEP